ncbi:MAG: tetratricopeptide repeat protein [Bdellovibrionales bacterium]|jgi:tetratricopeptide (TPR) repeat protein|nr:tetratricopeptide repeat protein [Bdellovibrionales bacterium]
MPSSSKRVLHEAGFRITVAAVLSIAVSGCATTRGAWTSDLPAVAYTESTVDVVNRAPASMSIPSDVEKTLDNNSMRAQADFHFTLAETFALEGNSQKAIEEYRLTLVYDPEAVQVRLRLAGEYVKQGMVNEAINQAKNAIELDGKSVEARMLLGGLYSSLRMYDEAMKQYELVQKQVPENYDAPMFVGALFAEQKKFSEAAVRFEKLAKNADNPNTHVAWYYLGRVRLEGNKDDVGGRAEYAFRQAIAARPSFMDPLLSLGALYEATGRREKALSLYANYQEQHGPSAVVAETLAQIYIEREQFDEALRQFEIMEAADPEDLNARMKIAFILIQEKRYKEAIVRLEDLLGRVPSADKVRFYLGAVYEEVKDYRAAVPHFLKIQPGSSFYAESRIHASYLYKLIGNSAKAVETIEDAIGNMPDHAPFYSLYASHLDERREYAKALTMLKSAVKRFPQSAQLQYFLGNMYDRAGDRKNTIGSMKAVLALDEDHVQALNYLAYTYAEAGEELDQAEKLARRALELKPQDGYIMDTLGWVMFKKGQFEAAVKVLEDAHRLQPDEAIIADHLGDAYYYFRMPERAKRYYEKAVALAEAGQRRQSQDQKAGQEGSHNGNENGMDASSGVSVEKIRAKIVIIDRQQDASATERRPASAR